jgi:hypothetical protein
MLSGSPVRKMSCLNETICRFKCEYGSPPTEKRVVSWKKTRFFVATAREEKGSNKVSTAKLFEFSDTATAGYNFP